MELKPKQTLRPKQELLVHACALLGATHVELATTGNSVRAFKAPRSHLERPLTVRTCDIVFTQGEKRQWVATKWEDYPRGLPRGVQPIEEVLGTYRMTLVRMLGVASLYLTQLGSEELRDKGEEGLPGVLQLIVDANLVEPVSWDLTWRGAKLLLPHNRDVDWLEAFVAALFDVRVMKAGCPETSDDSCRGEPQSCNPKDRLSK